MPLLPHSPLSAITMSTPIAPRRILAFIAASAFAAGGTGAAVLWARSYAVLDAMVWNSSAGSTIGALSSKGRILVCHSRPVVAGETQLVADPGLHRFSAAAMPVDPRRPLNDWRTGPDGVSRYARPGTVPPKSFTTHLDAFGFAYQTRHAPSTGVVLTPVTPQPRSRIVVVPLWFVTIALLAFPARRAAEYVIRRGARAGIAAANVKG
jgi:hypothetical protein